MRQRQGRRGSKKKASTSELTVGPWKLSVPAALALIALATFAAYLPAMRGEPLWDDHSHLTRLELQSFNGLYRIWFDLGATQQYYPLLHSAFWLEHRIWGDYAPGYHIINVVLHIAAVVLAYSILARLKVPGALLAAAIFALHPVMVESVAWISEQKNTLSAVFYLSAMLTYLNFDQSRDRIYYAAAIGLFILGLMTKTVTASLPAALLVIFWWQRGTIVWRRDVAPLIPFFVLGATSGLFTYWVERKLIGAEGASFELTVIQRGLLSGRVIWFYVGKLVWPANLIFSYPRWTIDPTQMWQWSFSIAALMLTAALWAMRKRWRAPLAGWLFFCGTLFPVLGFLNVYPFVFSYVADHFQYLASLGIIVLAATGIVNVSNFLPASARWVSLAFAILLVAMLGVATFRQSRVYFDALEFYQTIVERNSSSWMAHNNLAMELEDANRQSEAIEHYRTAVRLKPDYVEAHTNLGYALVRNGRIQEGIDEMQAALTLDAEFLPAHYNLGLTFLELGRLAEAIEQFEYIVRRKPDFVGVRTNLGVARIHQGEFTLAMEQFRMALTSDPTDATAQSNLGLLLSERDGLNESLAHLQNAVQLQPNVASFRNNYGVALHKAGRLREAIEQHQEALRLDPNFLQAYMNLAQALGEADRSDEAIAAARKAIELASANGQAAVVDQVNTWLTHYQIELRRGAKAAPSGVE